MDEVGNSAYVKHGQFRGLARVALSDLQHDRNHAFSPQNVSRLCRIFQIEGCQRLDERNFIDVLATDAQLDSVSPGILQETPLQTWETRSILDVGPLKCLTGQHRTTAAQRCLDANDQWWVARIYSDHLSHSPCLRLVEEYSNEKAPCDGEIFYKIRQYHLANDEANELKWWARLTETKRKDLKQLLRDARYTKAFDGMLPWPGLWTPVKLGSLHRLLCMKCDEELLAYLTYISEIWRRITANVDTSDIVDAGSVEKLQSLAPQHSTADAESISDLVAANKIFTRVTDAGQRGTILANLRSIQDMIPSLFTFFEDLKYLEPCAKVLKALLPPRGRQSVSRGLMGSYFQQEKLLVQHANGDTRTHTGSPSEIARTLAYQQLWLFAFRNFPLMTNFTTRKMLDKDKPAAVEPSPNEQISLLERCRRPFEDDHSKDRPYLYLPHLYRLPSTGRSITTFYRKWCMFRIFLNIKDTLENFQDDTMIENDDDDGVGHTTQPSRSDGCTEHDRMIGSLKSQLEHRDQESREAQTEHQRAIDLLKEELRMEAQRVSDLKRQLQEMEEKSNKDLEEKRDLSTELQEIRGNMSQTARKNETVVRHLKTRLDQSSEDRDGLRLQIARLEASACEYDKSNVDAQALGDLLREQLRGQLYDQKEKNTTLQNQHSAEILGLNNRIGALEREHTDSNAKHLSTALQGELAEHCLLQEASSKKMQELDEAMQRSTKQAQQDKETIFKLESHLGGAKVQIIKLETETTTASDKISSLEKELSEARECIKAQAQAVDQEQDTRYDAKVAVMNQKVEKAMAMEASKRILEELNWANDQGKEIEDKMKSLEASIQS
ncbi:hypothetical protein Q7P37_009981 [Cladosporium fusiforme]